MEAMNSHSISFDEAYNPDNDVHDSAAVARAVYISARHNHPDVLKPLRD